MILAQPRSALHLQPSPVGAFPRPGPASPKGLLEGTEPSQWKLPKSGTAEWGTCCETGQECAASGAVRASRPRSARHLRMTTSFNAIKDLRHGEERRGAAAARLEPRTAPMERNSYPVSALFRPTLAGSSKGLVRGEGTKGLIFAAAGNLDRGRPRRSGPGSRSSGGQRSGGMRCMRR